MNTSCSALNVICATPVHQYHEFIKKVSPIRENDEEVDKDINTLNNKGKLQQTDFTTTLSSSLVYIEKYYMIKERSLITISSSILHNFKHQKNHRTSPYRPQINGQTERMNQTLINMLKTLAERNESMKDKSIYEKLDQKMTHVLQ